jgi:hypothetical protein
MRKFEAIDLMKLYTNGKQDIWNANLTDCFNKRDINRLAKLRYQLSAGMDDLAKSKLNTDKINLWFIRLQRSIELTAKRIIKVKYPLPGDTMTIDNKSISDVEKRKLLLAKRKRDQELNKFMHDSNY